MPEREDLAGGGSALVVTRGLAVLLFFVTVRYWRVFWAALTNPPWSIVGFVSLLFAILVVSAAAGLFHQRKWGFYSAYLLVFVSTILHSIPLIPFVTDLLPTLNVRIAAMLLLNLTFLVATTYAHWKIRSEGRARPIPKTS